MIELVPITPDAKEEIFQLLENQPTKRDLWDWQYNANPMAANGSSGVVLVVDGKVAGFRGFMHTRLKMGASLVDAVWNNDTYVDGRFRGKGLGSKFTEYAEAIVPVAMAFGISDMQLPIYQKRNGWACNREVQEYFFQNRILSTKDLLKILIQSSARFKKSVSSTVYSIEDVPAKDIPCESDQIWERVQSGYDKIVVRNYEYLKWKYADHPCQSYRALLACDCGKLLAIAIYRGSADTGRLVDYLGPAHNPGLKEQLIESFMTACKDSVKLHVITTDKEFKQSLNRFGFRKYGTGPRFFIHTNPPYEHCEDGWFLMTGDSDGDLLDAMKDSAK